ncbi:hypothetical protein ACRE_013860 [Hapsidospora chrysogenum ATCC 11550]|uniref:Uncharacterized protein n=1 Tax=Hapsidospora chrysogenum (strain ATCC 11550 / CBS 779.69 / DSM 880 / IAM 14645 / JCM 23072 / IMI 49137) TaxID=857340 RepID=A0A086TEP7_HAPC1|nr:hypothetical protein ACRE_013860 [Hapsidospora chrysogenum ATCC 11550]
MKKLSTEGPVKLPTARTLSGNLHAAQALLAADQRPTRRRGLDGRMVEARRVESEYPRLQSIRGDGEMFGGVRRQMVRRSGRRDAR